MDREKKKTMKFYAGDGIGAACVEVESVCEKMRGFRENVLVAET